MDDSVCQKNLNTCAYWKTTLPLCNFGPIYKPGANGGEEIVFTYPAKKISAIPSLTDRASQKTTTATTITTSLQTDYITKEQTILHSEYPESSRSSTRGTGGVDSSTSASVGFEPRVTVAEGDTYTHIPTVDVVPVSIGVGLFSFALGMIIVMLIFRGNNARKAASRKRRNQTESVHLIDTGNQLSYREAANVEQTENGRYQDIQSLNTNIRMTNPHRNQEILEDVGYRNMVFRNYDNPEMCLKNLTNNHSSAECINHPVQSYDGNTFELKDM
ncbi:uncharacterized protein LOC134235592 [Saccostrea cucullata]|uniref:uncharacterized protein LOC134235592 n=1 Tax=Saccostrea cuccullata TaxID=36930 RepID=UPI002ED04DB3